jgi:protein gp37
MAEHSKIEWTDHTFNPWEGCQKVGPGCDHCYAEARDNRFTGGKHWGPGAPRRRTSAVNWRKPLAWDKAAKEAGVRYRVFCASLADVFDNAVPQGWRDDLWALIEATPNLDYLLLTKRPGNIANMLPVPFDFDKHFPNVWLGCTVVNQAEADRDIPKLLAVPAVVRFLSMEPLLGPVDLRPWIGSQPYIPGASTHVGVDGYERQDIGGGIIDGIDWIIVGGESGPGARPMSPQWARDIRDQCIAAGVAFHFKQNGEWVSVSEVEGPGDHFKFPDGRTVRRTGKKLAGRTLDGRTWDELPGGLI